MKKSQIKNEERELIKSVVKESPMYEGNEGLLDEFIDTIYKRSYLLIDAIHDTTRLRRHLATICDSSIEQVLQEKKQDDSQLLENNEAKKYDMIDEIEEEAVVGLNDPIEKYPPQKTSKDTVEKLIKIIRSIDSKYPDKQYYKIFASRYIQMYDQIETARLCGLSQTELSKRFVELIKHVREYI